MVARRMMPVRRGPGLVRTAATTAVIAGTATAVSGAVSGHQQAKAQQQMVDQAAFESQQQIADLQAQMAAMQAQQAQAAMAVPSPPPAPIPATTPGTDVMAQLQQLGQMKEAGLLSDAEFTAAKAKLLGM